MSETIWAKRLADLPEVAYEPPAGVKRPRMSMASATPEIRRHEFDRRPHLSLWWRTPSGGTSASPAAHWFGKWDLQKASATEILEHLYQGLEYPGTPSNYHFAIQSAHEALWKRRREYPAAVAEVERLCQLDIALVEAYPDMLKSGYGDTTSYAVVRAFDRLIKLYELSGDVEAALAVARRASRFGQARGSVERLEAKARAIAAEEGDEPDH